VCAVWPLDYRIDWRNRLLELELRRHECSRLRSCLMSGDFLILTAVWFLLS
jgi:hypothetical protein